MITWAIDLWPYVNGKLVMSGVRVEELMSDEMVNVFFYLMEEDLSYSTAEEIKVKDAVRKNLYPNILGRTYKYGMKESKTTYGSASEDWNTYPEPSEASKPYIPPTDFNPDSPLPFGGDIGAPLQ